MNYVDKMKDYLDKDGIASKLGFESKASMGEKLVSALSLFGVGVLVGAGVALLLAPKSGRELRQDIRDRVTGDGQGFAIAEDNNLPAPSFKPDQRVL